MITADYICQLIFLYQQALFQQVYFQQDYYIHKESMILNDAIVLGKALLLEVQKYGGCHKFETNYKL